MASVLIGSLILARLEAMRAGPDEALVDDVFGATVTNSSDDYGPFSDAVYVQIHRVHDSTGVRVVVAYTLLVSLIADPSI